jgi:nitrite reductase (NAD(P)H)
VFPIEERDDGYLYVKLPSVEELDSVLGTSKFKIKKSETEDPFAALDKKLERMQLKGRKGFQVSHLENGLGEKGKAAMILAGGERGAGGLDW